VRAAAVHASTASWPSPYLLGRAARTIAHADDELKRETGLD
jgi:hypothetical protein